MGTAAERVAYLDSVCGGDAELRRQVEKLLKAHPKVGDFLNQPAAEQLATGAAHPDDTPGGLAPGARLGVYEILGLLGAGGMGRVFRARDVRLGRPVAVKVLHDES